MGLKQVFVLIVGGLALLGAGTAALRPCAVQSSPPVRVTTEGAAAADLSPVAVGAAQRSTPQADLALRLVRGHADLLGGPASESRKEDLRFQAGLLAQSLRADPAAWDDVIDLLALSEPEEAALGAAWGLRESIEPAAESTLAGLVSRVPSSFARRLALVILGRRDSGVITSALVTSLQSPDPRLRAEVLEGLAYRRGIAGSSAAGPVVDAALRSRAESEPDPALRRAERCLVGDEVASALPTPARRAPLSSSALGSRSR